MKEFFLTTGYAASKYIGVALIGFFAPILYAFIFAIILVLIDTVTGVMKGGKHSIKDVTSRKAFPIVPKLIFYSLLIIAGHGCSFVEPEIPFVKLALIGIGWIEIKSIDENFNDIYGFSFINSILSGVKSINKIQRNDHKKTDKKQL